MHFIYETLSSLYMTVSAWCLVLNLLIILVISFDIIPGGLSFLSLVIRRVGVKDGMMGEALLLQFYLLL